MLGVARCVICLRQLSLSDCDQNNTQADDMCSYKYIQWYTIIYTMPALILQTVQLKVSHNMIIIITHKPGAKHIYNMERIQGVLTHWWGSYDWHMHSISRVTIVISE